MKENENGLVSSFIVLTKSVKKLAQSISRKGFIKRVKEIREMEAAHSARRQCLEALFQSMLHRAFNGEL